VEIEEEALALTLWRARFGKVYDALVRKTMELINITTSRSTSGESLILAQVGRNMYEIMVNTAYLIGFNLYSSVVTYLRVVERLMKNKAVRV
jgi:hypothetical protein